MNEFNVQYLFGATSNLLQVHQARIPSSVATEGSLFMQIVSQGGFHSVTDGKWITPTAVIEITKL